MARRPVVEVTCDRCGRVETQEAGASPKKDGVTSEASVTFHGETVTFEDLCKRCRDAVKGYYTRLAKIAEDQVPPPPPKEEPVVEKKKGFLGGVGGK